MEEFKVPTTPIEAELQLADGRVLRGTVFVPASTSVHSTFKRLDEWVNEASAFFPFRVEKAEGAELVGKRSVTRLSVPAPTTADADLPTGVERRHVIVEAAGSRFEGDILLDMPDHQRRVLDYVNQPGSFLSLHDGETVHLIQKDKIVRIVQSAS